jgi:hypothetical protein
MSVADYLLDNHRSIVSRVMSWVRYGERLLGPDDDWVEDDRRLLFETLNPLGEALGRPLVQRASEQGFVGHVPTSPDAYELRLVERGYQRNLASTRKYRIPAGDGGRQWAVGSWVLDPVEEPWQHHVYLFRGRDGGVDVYAHLEPSVRRPREHVSTDTGVHGDPLGLLGDIHER